MIATINHNTAIVLLVRLRSRRGAGADAFTAAASASTACASGLPQCWQAWAWSLIPLLHSGQLIITSLDIDQEWGRIERVKMPVDWKRRPGVR
jgi:hypothetical protein